jgi:flagellar motor switch protein FliG
VYAYICFSEYLKENNEMMKKQFETLSQWKQKVHDANIMNREKFEQTRALITALRSENEELQTKFRASTGNEVRI